MNTENPVKSMFVRFKVDGEAAKAPAAIRVPDVRASGHPTEIVGLELSLYDDRGGGGLLTIETQSGDPLRTTFGNRPRNELVLELDEEIVPERAL